MQSSLQRKVFTIFLFVVFLNLFLFHGFGSVAFALLVGGFFIFLVCIFTPVKTKADIQTTVCAGILLLVLQLLFVNRDSWFITVILGLSTLVGLAVYTYLISARLGFVRSLLEFILIPVHLALTYIQSGLGFLQKVLEQDFSFIKRKTGLSSRFSSLFVGLLIGIPIVVILVTLFSAADPIFSSYVNKLFGNIKLGNIQTRLIFSAIWLALLSPFILFERKKGFHSPIAQLEKMSLTREMSVVMTLVAITVGAFLVVQFNYIFINVPAETDLSKFGVKTYSEYVTKGFIELLLVSFFIYGIIWLGLVFLRNKRKVEQKPLLYLQLIVWGEFGIFLVSIARRVWLYQAHHGLSLTRVYGSFFLVWVAFITLTLFARHFWTRRWVRLELAITVLFILAFGFFNAENYIVETNPPHVNKRTDYVYLSRMSSDGIVGWKKAIEYTKDVLTLRGYQSKQLLDREDRREIAYAGQILSRQIARYNDLVHHYATDAEWLDYIHNIYRHLLSINSKQLLLTEVNVKNVLPNPPRISKSFLEKKRQDIVDHIASVEKRVPARNSDISVTVPFLPAEFQEAYGDCSGQQYTSIACDQTFYAFGYDYPFGKRTDKPDKFTILLTWNGSRARAYENVKDAIPVGQLIALTESYIELHNKILNQPANQKEYDIDISFDTPFLGGL